MNFLGVTVTLHANEAVLFCAQYVLLLLNFKFQVQQKSKQDLLHYIATKSNSGDVLLSLVVSHQKGNGESKGENCCLCCQGTLMLHQGSLLCREIDLN